MPPEIEPKSPGPYANTLPNRPISDMRNQYTVTVKKKLDTQQETSSERHIPNDEYEHFVTAHIEAAVECILSRGVP